MKIVEKGRDTLNRFPNQLILRLIALTQQVKIGGKVGGVGAKESIVVNIGGLLDQRGITRIVNVVNPPTVQSRLHPIGHASPTFALGLTDPSLFSAARKRIFVRPRMPALVPEPDALIVDPKNDLR